MTFELDDLCAICDIGELNNSNRRQNSVNLNKSVPAKLDRLFKGARLRPICARVVKRMRLDMFGVVSFLLLGTCFKHLCYFNQMCALNILKTLIWIHTFAQSHLFSNFCFEEQMHFQLSLAVTQVVRANKHLSHFFIRPLSQES